MALLVVIALVWRPLVAADPKPALPTAAEIDSVLKELSSITGFKIHRQLPFVMVNREQIGEYLKEQIKHSVKPDSIRAEETSLKKFGFVRPDFDLKKITIELLTEQAAAFYDFHRKKLYISDWASVNMRESALIHELAHALADQNFSIQKFIRKGADNSEASMAREAVVEGQASWLMLEVEARRAGKTLANADTARALLTGSPDSDDPASPVFNKAPLYLRKTMLFPYDQGQTFQEAVFLHDGQAAFARVFTQPPVSTSQIVHPDRYFGGDVPEDPKLPDPPQSSRPFVTGSLGELETKILLQQYVGEGWAEDLGPKLKGSNYRIDEGKKDHRMTLVYASEWRDAAAAKRFFDAYQQVLRGKWNNVEAGAPTENQFAGKSEDGYFKVTLDGKNILSQEGFDQPPASSK